MLLTRRGHRGTHSLLSDGHNVCRRNDCNLDKSAILLVARRRTTGILRLIRQTYSGINIWQKVSQWQNDWTIYVYFEKTFPAMRTVEDYNLSLRQKLPISRLLTQIIVTSTKEFLKEDWWMFSSSTVSSSAVSAFNLSQFLCPCTLLDHNVLYCT
jgi:hypothetical protein